MSIDIKQVFAAVFPSIYTYDEQYDEIRSNGKLDVMSYSYNIRKLIYDNYHKLKDMNENALTVNELEVIKDTDPDVKYIRDLYNQMEVFDVDKNMKAFKHLTREDYYYLNLNANDQDHTNLKYIVKYDKSVLNTDEDIYNIDYFVSKNIYPIKNTYNKELICKYISYKHLDNKRLSDSLFKDNKDIQTVMKSLLNRFVIGNKIDIMELANKINIINNDNYMKTYMRVYVDMLRTHDTPNININREIVRYAFDKVVDYYDHIISKHGLTLETFTQDVLIHKYVNTDNFESVLNKVKQVDGKIELATIKKLLTLYSKLGINIDFITELVEYFKDYKNILESYITIMETTKGNVSENVIKSLLQHYDDINEYVKKNSRSIFTQSCLGNKQHAMFNELYKLIIRLVNIAKFNVHELDFITQEWLYNIDNTFSELANVIIKHACQEKKMTSLLVNKKFNNNRVNLYVNILYNLMSEDIMKKNIDNKEIVLTIIETFNVDDGLSKMEKNKIRMLKYSYHTLSYYYVSAYKEAPPFTIYCGPSTENLAAIWSNVCSMEVPLEMTNQKYYDYMISHDGEKRPANITAMYSYFSNTAENKLIFISNDDTLDKPARLRYIIPVSYDKIKEFITEDIETNGICLFTTVSNADWAKIARSNERLDIVAFSDIKNILKERTSMKSLIQFFKDAIELKFDCQLKMEEL